MPKKGLKLCGITISSKTKSKGGIMSRDYAAAQAMITSLEEYSGNTFVK